MKRLLWPVLVLALSACSSRNNVQPVGNDRDSHGCLLSGGYTWCAKEKSCVRLWELAKKKHLPPGQSAEEYCKGN
jgi:hypothetical protein